MTGKLSAILLAAGESRRMGRPKLLRPWGDESVLGYDPVFLLHCQEKEERDRSGSHAAEERAWEPVPQKYYVIRWHICKKSNMFFLH
jgi:hypothetical protein